MGLAEPRKRLKIAHDPRNLSWSQSSSSYGQRLMQQQGWQAGQSLGARSSTSAAEDDVARLAASRVGVLFKDDTLGLGAKLKSKDVQQQKTGLDAFQGLLRRLNSKNEAEVKEVEKKIEDKKLVMYAQGRWGGMVFVPGGVLVQGEEFKKKDLKIKKEQEETKADVDDIKVKLEEREAKADQEDVKVKIKIEEETDDGDEAVSKADKKRRKAERQARRDEKRVKKEAKAARKQARESAVDTPADSDTSDNIRTVTKISPPAPDEPVSSAEEEIAKAQIPESTAKRRWSSITIKETVTKPVMRNGRHLLRGRNIQAKRMAFSDAKGLDEIFMKKA